jgi:hypothetical protein
MRSAHDGCFQTEIRKNMLETAAFRCDRPVKGRPHLLRRVITRPRPEADQSPRRSEAAVLGGHCYEGDHPMTAWDELQQWLMLNVGSRESDECSEIVKRIV